MKILESEKDGCKKTMKKIVTCILVALTFMLACADEKDLISLYNFNTMEMQQEIIVSRYDITRSKIDFFIHLKMNENYVYLLKYSDGKMVVRKVSSENYSKLIYTIKQLLNDKKISETEYPLSDDASNVMNIVFKGDIDLIINPFNTVMLKDDDYRKLLCREVFKFSDRLDGK